MNSANDESAIAAAATLERCFTADPTDWSGFDKPDREMLNFATRYHLVYPALAYFIQCKQKPELAARLRPQLDAIYQRLIDSRCWRYWYDELGESTWPLQERNLTYAGRLATFVGLYIDTYGEPPATRIELDGRSTSYQELSHNLWQQMTESRSCSVSCYHHQSMVMCMAHLLMNNVIHDRLFGTKFAACNERWLQTVESNLLRTQDDGCLFYYGTQANAPAANKEKQAIGADIWTLFLMSSVVPDSVQTWFSHWRTHLVDDGTSAHVQVPDWEERSEFSCNELATAWTYCLAQELGESALATRLRAWLSQTASTGFALDPYVSGLFLLGDQLRTKHFFALVHGETLMSGAD